jgi:FkbM family methyltransferase
MEWVSIRGYPHRFYFRHATTDKYVMSDVLLFSEYGFLLGLDGVTTVLDIGANIGTTSVLLLNAYPNATVIAIEPDQGNFEILEKNLRPYGARAILLRSALWNREEDLMVDRGHFRDGGEWSFQVKTRDLNERADVKGVTLRDLIARYDLQTIDILKIDIEGAERHVFDSSIADSLSMVKHIAIELHDEESRRLFVASVAGFPGQLSEHGDVTFWTRT